jgi:hypothetical protein
LPKRFDIDPKAEPNRDMLSVRKNDFSPQFLQVRLAIPPQGPAAMAVPNKKAWSFVSRLNLFIKPPGGFGDRRYVMGLALPDANHRDD